MPSESRPIQYRYRYIQQTGLMTKRSDEYWQGSGDTQEVERREGLIQFNGTK